LKRFLSAAMELCKDEYKFQIFFVTIEKNHVANITPANWDTAVDLLVLQQNCDSISENVCVLNSIPQSFRPLSN